MKRIHHRKIPPWQHSQRPSDAVSSQVKPEEASTHKSAKTDASTVTCCTEKKQIKTNDEKQQKNKTGLKQEIRFQL